MTTPDEPTTGSVVPGPGSGPAPVPAEAPAPEATGNAAYAAMRKELAAAKAANKKLQGEFDTLRQQGMTEAEQAVAKARTEGAAEFQQRWRATVLANEALKLLAAKGVQGAELALGAMDLSDVDVDANGRVDAALLGQKIDDVLARYPMLAPSTPQLPNALGAGQTRVTGQQLVGLSDDKAKRNELLRWAMSREG